MDKKRIMILLLLCLICISIVILYFNPFSLTKKDLAVTYLTNHYNPTIGLLFESEDVGIKNFGGWNYTHNQIYWIYSDNLIATWALKPFNSQLSEMINQTIQSYNLSPSHFFEVLFGQPIPRNPFNAVYHIIEQHQDWVIMAEFHNTSTQLLWKNYSDTLIYQSLNLYLQGNRTGAEDYFYQAYNMWDGKRINDLSFQNETKFANFKLALILFASKILNLPIEHFTQIEDTLWSMQQENGGITSLADENGYPVGSANTETTAMTLLPYNNELITRIQNLSGE
jgi:hypothetical protein